jgi:hypothetical protein
MPSTNDPYRRAQQEQAAAEDYVAAQQRDAERLATQQAKQAAKEQKAAADAARKAALTQTEYELRSQGITPWTGADGNLYPDPLHDQKQAEEARKAEQERTNAAAIDTARRSGRRFVESKLTGQPIYLQSEEALAAERAAKAEAARRKKLDDEIKAAQAERDFTVADKGYKPLTETARRAIEKKITGTEQAARLALQGTLTEKTKSLVNDNDWVPFNEAPSPEAQTARQRLERLSDPTAPFDEQDLADLAANDATKPHLDNITRFRDLLAKDKEAQDYLSAQEKRLADLTLRRDAPEKWAEITRQRRAEMDPETLASDLDQSKAEIEQRDTALATRVQTINAKREVTATQIDQLSQQAAQRRQSGLTAGEIVTFTKPDGTVEHWPKDLAEQFERVQAQQADDEAQQADELTGIEAERADLQRLIDLHNESAQLLQTKEQTVQQQVKTSTDRRLRYAPGMAGVADQLDALRQEHADRAAVLEQDGSEFPEEARAALDQDIQTRMDTLLATQQQRLAAADAAVSGIQSQLAANPDLNADAGKLYNDAAKNLSEALGISPAEAKTLIDDAEKATQWDMVRGDDKTDEQQPGWLEAPAKAIVKAAEGTGFVPAKNRGNGVKTRLLSNGGIVVNPTITDKAEYEAAVKASGATPDAQAEAMERYPEIRKRVAQDTLDTIKEVSSVLGEDSLNDWTSWKEWQAKRPADVDPAEWALRWSEDNKSKNTGILGTLLSKTKQFTRNLAAAGNDLRAQFSGLVAGVTGNETAMQDAQWANRKAQAHQSSLELGGHTSGNFISEGFFGMLPRVAGSILPAAGGAKIAQGGIRLFAGTKLGARWLPSLAAAIAKSETPAQSIKAIDTLTRAGLGGAAAAGAGQTYAAQLVDIYSTLRKEHPELDHKTALRQAQMPAVVSGLATAALTVMGGPKGVERLLTRPDGVRKMLGQAFANQMSRFGFVAKEFLKGGLRETFLEEAPDELISAVAQAVGTGHSVQQAVADFLQTLPSFTVATTALGGLGEGIDALQRSRVDPNTPTNRANLPNSIARAEAAIDKLQLPGMDDATREQAQRRAALVLSLAQGGELFDVEETDLNAAGWTRDGDTFKPLKGYTGPAVLDIDKGGRPIIKDSYVQNLRDDGLAAVADAIPSTETQTRNRYAQKPTAEGPQPASANQPGPQQPQPAAAQGAAPNAGSSTNAGPVQNPAQQGTQPTRSGSAPAQSGAPVAAEAPSTKAPTTEKAIADWLVDRYMPDKEAEAAAKAIAAHPQMAGKSFEDFNKMAGSQRDALFAELGITGSKAKSKAADDPLRYNSASADPFAAAKANANKAADELLNAVNKSKTTSPEDIADALAKAQAAYDDTIEGTSERAAAEKRIAYLRERQVVADLAPVKASVKAKEITEADATAAAAQAVEASGQTLTHSTLRQALELGLGWTTERSNVAAHNHLGTKDQSETPLATGDRADTANRPQPTPFSDEGKDPSAARMGPDLSIKSKSPLRKNSAYSRSKLLTLARIKDPAKKAWARQAFAAMEDSFQRHHALYDAIAVGPAAVRRLNGSMTAVEEIDGRITRLLDLDAIVANFDYLSNPADAIRATGIEEDIHAVVLRLARTQPEKYGREAIRRQWRSLPQMLRAQVWQAYDYGRTTMPAKLTAAQEYHMQNEFLRMLVQDQAFAQAITETVDTPTTLVAWIRDLLRDLSKTLRDLMGLVDAPLRAELEGMVAQIADQLRIYEGKSRGNEDRLATLDYLRDPAGIALQAMENGVLFDHLAKTDPSLSPEAMARAFDLLTPELQSIAYRAYRSSKQPGTKNQERKENKSDLLRHLLTAMTGDRSVSREVQTALLASSDRLGFPPELEFAQFIQGGTNEGGSMPNARQRARIEAAEAEGREETPAGGHGSLMVWPDEAQFVRKHGFGRTHLNTTALAMYQAAKAGSQPAMDRHARLLVRELTEELGESPENAQNTADTLMSAAKMAAGTMQGERGRPAGEAPGTTSSTADSQRGYLPASTRSTNLLSRLVSRLTQRTEAPPADLLALLKQQPEAARKTLASLHARLLRASADLAGAQFAQSQTITPATLARQVAAAVTSTPPPPPAPAVNTAPQSRPVPRTPLAITEAPRPGASRPAYVNPQAIDAMVADMADRRQRIAEVEEALAKRDAEIEAFAKRNKIDNLVTAKYKLEEQERREAERRKVIAENRAKFFLRDNALREIEQARQNGRNVEKESLMFLLGTGQIGRRRGAADLRLMGESEKRMLAALGIGVDTATDGGYYYTLSRLKSALLAVEYTLDGSAERQLALDELDYVRQQPVEWQTAPDDSKPAYVQWHRGWEHLIIRDSALADLALTMPNVAAAIPHSESERRATLGLPAQPAPTTERPVSAEKKQDSPSPTPTASPTHTRVEARDETTPVEAPPAARAPAARPSPKARIPLGGKLSLPAEFASQDDLDAFNYQLDRESLLRETTTAAERRKATERIQSLRARLIDESGATKEAIEQKLADYHRAVIDGAKKADPVEVYRPTPFHAFAGAITDTSEATLPAPVGGDIISGMKAQGIRHLGPPDNSDGWAWYRELKADAAMSKMKPREANRLAKAGDITDAKARLAWIDMHVVSQTGGRSIDEAAAELNESEYQQFPITSGEELGRAIMDAIATRLTARDAAPDPVVQAEKQAIQQGGDFRAVAEGAPGQPFTGRTLAARVQTGDEIQIGSEWLTVTDIDAEEGTVALDSDRYGPQAIEPDQTIRLRAIGDESLSDSPATRSTVAQPSLSDLQNDPDVIAARDELLAAMREAGMLSASDRMGAIGYVNDNGSVSLKFGQLSKLRHSETKHAQNTFRYVAAEGTVFWWKTPTELEQEAVAAEFERRGYSSPRHKNILTSDTESSLKTQDLIHGKLPASHRFTPEEIATVREELASNRLDDAYQGGNAWFHPRTQKWINLGMEPHFMAAPMIHQWGYGPAMVDGWARVVTETNSRGERTLGVEFYGPLTRRIQRVMFDTALTRGIDPDNIAYDPHAERYYGKKYDDETGDLLSASPRQLEKLRDDVLRSNLLESRMRGPRAWLTPRAEWINVQEHREVFPPKPHILHSYDAMHQAGFVRVAHSMLLHAEFHTGRLTPAQRRELENTAIERQTELSLDPQPLPASPRFRNAASQFADTAWNKNIRSFPAFLDFAAKTVPEAFPVLKTPHLRSAWNTILNEKDFPEITRAEEADALRPYGSPKIERRFGEMPPDIAARDESITPESLGIPTVKLAKQAKPVPPTDLLGNPIAEHEEEDEDESGDSEDKVQNRGSTELQRLQAIDELYGPLAPGVEVMETQNQDGDTVPHIMRGRGLMLAIDGQPHVAIRSVALPSIGTGHAPGVRFLPLAGDKSNWTGHINKALRIADPQLDDHTDIYIEPYGGGLVYLQNLEPLLRTTKPVFIASSQEFEPDRNLIYTTLQRGDAAALADIQAILSDINHKPQTDAGEALVRVFYTKSKKRIVRKLSPGAAAQLPNLVALLQRPNVKILPWNDVQTFERATAFAQQGKRVTLLEDSNYADLYAEKTQDQYKDIDTHPDMFNAGKITDFIGKDPKKLLTQKLPVYRAVLDAGGTVIATNNMNPDLINGLLAEFGDAGHWFGYAHRTRPVPDGFMRHPDGKGVLWSTERPEYLAILRKGVVNPTTGAPKYGTDTSAGLDYRTGPRRLLEGLDRAAQPRRTPSPHTGGSLEAAQSLRGPTHTNGPSPSAGPVPGSDGKKTDPRTPVLDATMSGGPDWDFTQSAQVAAELDAGWRSADERDAEMMAAGGIDDTEDAITLDELERAEIERQRQFYRDINGNTRPEALQASRRIHPATGQPLAASSRKKGPTFPGLKKPTLPAPTPRPELFDEWAAALGYANSLYGYRGEPTPGERTGYGNTEGNGIYLMRSRDEAEPFGHVRRVQFPEPHRPFLVTGDDLYLLNESEDLDQPIDPAKDTPWLQASKYAAQHAHNLGKGRWDAQLAGDILTKLLMESGYDSVYVKGMPDDWVVLLRTTRPGQKPLAPLPASARTPSDAGTSARTSPRLAAAPREVEPGFYSKLEQVITDKLPAKGNSPASVKALLENNGVKTDEIKWSGLLPWLQEQAKTGPIAQSALLDYLRTQGAVKFSVTQLGGPLIPANDEKRYRELVRISDPTPEQEAERIAIFHRRHNARKSTAETRNTQWQLPGGTNPQEVVITWNQSLPPEPTHEDRANSMSRRELIQWYRTHIFDDIPQDASEDAVTTERLRQLFIQNATLHPSNNPYYKTPPRVSPNYPEDTTHYGDLDALAWYRANDRTLDGSPGLFVEEFQSKWHQLGRDKGYRGDRQANGLPTAFTLKENAGGWSVYDAQGRDAGWAETQEDAIKAALKYEGGSDTGIPDAPYRTAWPLMLFKRALRDAVEAGKAWIGWTTGDTQADRYDLSKQVDRIRYIPGHQRLLADKGGTNVIDQTVPPEKLADHVGKDIAERLLNNPTRIIDALGGAQHELSGLDLRVGGEGMRKFYDDILVKEFGKYVKQWGGKVEQSEINTSTTLSTPEFKPISGSDWETFAGAEAFANGDRPLFAETTINVDGQPESVVVIIDANGLQMVSSEGETNWMAPNDVFPGQTSSGWWRSAASAQSAVEIAWKVEMSKFWRELQPIVGEGVATPRQGTTPIWRITITPQMRESVSRGQPLFAATRFPLDRALAPTATAPNALFAPSPRLPVSPSPSLLNAAYTAAARGQSSQWLPIRAVFAQARLLDPRLTPDAFMAAVKAADDAGTVYLSPPESAATVAAAGPFQLRNASGIVVTDMTLAPSALAASNRRNSRQTSGFLAPQGVAWKHGESRLIQGLAQADAFKGTGVGLVSSESEKPETYTRTGRSIPPYTERADLSDLAYEEAKLIERASAEGFFWDNAQVEKIIAYLGDAGGGTEHDVYITGEKRHLIVIRSTILDSYGFQGRSPAQYLQRLQSYNTAFPGIQTRMIGVSRNTRGNGVIWTVQPFVEGIELKDDKRLQSLMEAKGWVRIDGPGDDTIVYRHPPTGAIIRDAHTGNILVKGKELFPIDVIVTSLGSLSEVAPSPSLLVSPSSPLPAAQRVEQAAAQVEPNPTPAQQDAGNYQKGHLRWNGLDLTLENPRGTERTGRSKDGREWSVTLPHHYGYIKGTTGKDKDHIDFFMGPNPDSDHVLIINQRKLETSNLKLETGAAAQFDEHKIMLGFPDAASAARGYLAAYEPGWKGLQSAVPTTVAGLKHWLTHGNHTRPAKPSDIPVNDVSKVNPVPLTAAAAARPATTHTLPDGYHLTGPGLHLLPASIRAHHGTPHDIPLESGFSTAKIGSGEGAQVYGWGLYFAEAMKVAEQYRKALSYPIFRIGDKEFFQREGPEAFKKWAIAHVGQDWPRAAVRYFEHAVDQFYHDSTTYGYSFDAASKRAKDTIRNLLAQEQVESYRIQEVTDALSRITDNAIDTTPYDSLEGRWTARAVGWKPGEESFSIDAKAFNDIWSRLGWYAATFADAPARLKSEYEAQLNVQSEEYDRLLDSGRTSADPMVLDTSSRVRLAQAALDLLNSGKVVPEANKRRGNLYTVELLGDPAEFLDWNDDLINHPQEIQQRFMDALLPVIGHQVVDGRLPEYRRSMTSTEFPWLVLNTKGYSTMNDYATREEAEQGRKELDHNYAYQDIGSTYRDASQQKGMTPQKVSEALAKAGIKGIRYTDAASRYRIEKTSHAWEVLTSTGKLVAKEPTEEAARAAMAKLQTYNYVLFDDKLVKIIERNGQPLSSSPSLAASPRAQRLQAWQNVPGKGDPESLQTGYISGKHNATIAARAKERGDIGLLITPLIPSYLAHTTDYPFVAIDNGVFSKATPFDPAAFKQLVDRVAATPAVRAKTLFVVAPDVVGDAAATLDRFPEWARFIHDKQLPVALAAQDGLEDIRARIPWDDIDVLFIGGSTEWKTGQIAPAKRAAWAGIFMEAHRRSIPVHMGRVNTNDRIAGIAQIVGASTVDGTYLAFGPDKNLPKLERMLDQLNVHGNDLGAQQFPELGRAPSINELYDIALDDTIISPDQLGAYEPATKEINAIRVSMGLPTLDGKRDQQLELALFASPRPLSALSSTVSRAAQTTSTAAASIARLTGLEAPLATLGSNNLDKRLSAALDRVAAPKVNSAKAAALAWLNQTEGAAPTVKGFIDQLLPNALMPREWLALKHEMDRKAAFGAEQANDLIRALSDKARLSDLAYPPEFSQDPKWRMQMFDAMEGKLPLSSLPEPLQRLAERLRTMLRQTGEELVKQGLMNPDTFEELQANGWMPRYTEDEALAAGGSFLKAFKLGVRDLLQQRSTAYHVVDTSRRDRTGQYVTVNREEGGKRNRWRFRDKAQRDAWFQTFLRQHILTQLRDESPEVKAMLTPMGRNDRAAVRDQIRKLTLDDFAAKEALSPVLRRMIKDLSYQAQQRFQTVDPFTPEKLVKDPVYAVARYVLGQSHNAATMELMRSTAANPEWTTDVDTAGFTLIPDSPRFGPLAGKYLREDIARQILDLVDVPNAALRAYDGLLRKWKAAKLVWNPGSHIRDAIGNTVFAYLGGNSIWNPGNWQHYRDAIQILREGQSQDGTTFAELLEQQVLGGDAYSTQVKERLKGLLPDTKTIEDFNPGRLQRTLMGFGSAFHGTNEWLSDIRRVPDDFYKIAAYLRYKSQFKNLKPETSNLELQSRAAAEVRKWFPYYDRLGSSGTTKAIGRFINPFFSFFRESTRILLTAAHERPLALTAALAFPAALSSLSAMLLGLDDRDREEIEKDLAGRGLGILGLGNAHLFSILLPMRSSQGQVQQWDISSTMPFADLLGSRIVPLEEKESAFQTAWRKLLSAGPVMGLAYSWATNRDTFSGRHIVEADMTTGEQLRAYTGHAAGVMLPPLAPDLIGAGPLSRAGEVQTNKTLQTYDPTQTWLRSFFGLNVKSAEPNLYRLADDFRVSQGIQSTQGYDYGTTRESRAKRALVAALAQPEPDLARVKVLAEKLRELGISLATPKDIEKVLKIIDPAQVIGGGHRKDGTGITAADARQRFRASLPPEARQNYEQTLQLYQRILARAPVIITRARNQ